MLKNRFNEFYENRLESDIKIPADLLPVGHFIDEIPKFYNNGEWFESPEYLSDRTEYIENDIIVGYDYKIKNSVNILFKLRPPIQKNANQSDNRKLEKGTVCAYKNKLYLKNIAKKLDVELDGDKNNVTSICSRIRMND